MNQGLSFRRTLLTLFLSAIMVLALSGTSQAQGNNFVSRYINKMVNDTVNDGRAKFLFYPTVAFAPETSWEFGFNSLCIFHAKGDTTNRLSEIFVWSFITLERQYGIWSDHAIYSNHNNWFFLGRARYQRFPLLYHGIGPETPEEFTALVDADYLLAKERILRRLHGSLFAGLELDFQGLTRTEFLPEDEDNPFDFPTGAEGSQNFSIGAGIVYDSRHNVLNVRDGLFGELAFLHSNELWGSDYNFSTLIADARIYRPVRKNQVFAAQTMGLFTMGDVPFNQMALMGGESLMRGYYLGRYRDKNLLASQVEYRFLPFVDRRPLRRWGGAVFMAAGSVFSEEDPFHLSNFVLAGGGGLRFLIFPEKDVYTRLDVAFTREGPGFYLFIGESF